jgi:hypothetical protein
MICVLLYPAIIMANLLTHEFTMPPSATLSTSCGLLVIYLLFYAISTPDAFSTPIFTSYFLRHWLVNPSTSFWVLSTQLYVSFPTLGAPLQCFLRFWCSTCCYLPVCAYQRISTIFSLTLLPCSPMVSSETFYTLFICSCVTFPTLRHPFKTLWTSGQLYAII